MNVTNDFGKTLQIDLICCPVPPCTIAYCLSLVFFLWRAFGVINIVVVLIRLLIFDFGFIQHNQIYLKFLGFTAILFWKIVVYFVLFACVFFCCCFFFFVFNWLLVLSSFLFVLFVEFVEILFKFCLITPK